jgi:hypothetical protein
MDSAIDKTLTALRAGTPLQADCSSALNNLKAVIGTLEAKS